MAEPAWQKAQFENGKLEFDSTLGLSLALKDGFFFVKSEGIDFSAGDRFAANFYLDCEDSESDPYKGFRKWPQGRIAEYQGYIGRDSDQTEQFFLERHYWEKIFPPRVGQLAEQVRLFALRILVAILDELDIPKEFRDVGTGGCLSDNGSYHFTFNHFRSNIRARGLNVHKDSGWVTVLRTLEPGLFVQKEGEWIPIDPLPGYCIVNFGCAMEILTRNCSTPVSAVAHKVVETEQRDGFPDRFSYALFVDSSLDESKCKGLYSYLPGKGLEFEISFREFLDDILANTYEEDSEGLY